MLRLKIDKAFGESDSKIITIPTMMLAALEAEELKKVNPHNTAYNEDCDFDWEFINIHCQVRNALDQRAQPFIEDLLKLALQSDNVELLKALNQYSLNQTQWSLTNNLADCNVYLSANCDHELAVIIQAAKDNSLFPDSLALEANLIRLALCSQGSELLRTVLYGNGKSGQSTVTSNEIVAPLIRKSLQVGDPELITKLKLLGELPDIDLSFLDKYLVDEKIGESGLPKGIETLKKLLETGPHEVILKYLTTNIESIFAQNRVNDVAIINFGAWLDSLIQA